MNSVRMSFSADENSDEFSSDEFQCGWKFGWIQCGWVFRMNSVRMSSVRMKNSDEFSADEKKSDEFSSYRFSSIFNGFSKKIVPVLDSLGRPSAPWGWVFMPKNDTHWTHPNFSSALNSSADSSALKLIRTEFIRISIRTETHPNWIHPKTHPRMSS